MGGNTYSYWLKNIFPKLQKQNISFIYFKGKWKTLGRFVKLETAVEAAMPLVSVALSVSVTIEIRKDRLGQNQKDPPLPLKINDEFRVKTLMRHCSHN